jgi:16S rRNA pseudouridine516 synthase
LHSEVCPLLPPPPPPPPPPPEPALSTIGRLDKETSGLLLLTDDGALLHRIISPKASVSKRYQVTLDRPLRGDEGAVLSSGTLMLEGEEKPLLPVTLEVHGPTSAAVTLTEGRYHQVRRMFAALGNHVTALHRDRVGALDLPADLEPGQVRVMGEGDVARVFGSGSSDT